MTSSDRLVSVLHLAGSLAPICDDTYRAAIPPIQIPQMVLSDNSNHLTVPLPVMNNLHAADRAAKRSPLEGNAIGA